MATPDQRSPAGGSSVGTERARERFDHDTKVETDMRDQEKDPGADNRGRRAPQSGSGEVVGSGAGAGGGGNPEDFDSDPPGGGGAIPTGKPNAPVTGADAPVHGSR